MRNKQKTSKDKKKTRKNVNACSYLIKVVEIHRLKSIKKNIEYCFFRFRMVKDELIPSILFSDLKPLGTNSQGFFRRLLCLPTILWWGSSRGSDWCFLFSTCYYLWSNPLRWLWRIWKRSDTTGENRHYWILFFRTLLGDDLQVFRFETVARHFFRWWPTTKILFLTVNTVVPLVLLVFARGPNRASWKGTSSTIAAIAQGWTR